MPRRDQLFESVTSEGALLPSDFLTRLAQRDREIPGLTPDAYHLGSGEILNEASSISWNSALGVRRKSADSRVRSRVTTSLPTSFKNSNSPRTELNHSESPDSN